MGVNVLTLNKYKIIFLTVSVINVQMMISANSNVAVDTGVQIGDTQWPSPCSGTARFRYTVNKYSDPNNVVHKNAKRVKSDEIKYPGQQ